MSRAAPSLNDAAAVSTPLRILLVEDNPGDVGLVRAHLADADVRSELVHAESLEDARALLRDRRVDLCLLDLGLPGSTGPATVERFRDFGGDLPVVVLTGLDDADAAVGALRVGADEYLVKGELSSRELHRTIRHVLERDRFRREQREAEEKWAKLLEASPIPVVVSDAEAGRVIEMNEAFVELFGRSRDAMVGRTALEMGQWAEPARRAELLEKVRDEGRFDGEEADFVDADGRRGRMLVGCRRLESVEGEGERLVWTVQDITERVERERAVVERVKEQSCLYDISQLLHDDSRPLRERLQAVVDRIPAGWQYPEVTAARLRVGDDRYESEGFEETEHRLEAGLAVEGEPAGELEVGYREERPEEDVGPFLTEERRLLDEIAEQIEVELSRQKTSMEMGHLTETMNEAVVIVSPDGGIVFANSAARGLFGVSEDDLVDAQIGQFNHRVTTPGGDPCSPGELPFEAVRRSGEPVAGQELAVEQADGSRLILSVNAAPMRGDGGSMEGVVLTARDVTDRHREAEWRHLLESSVEAAVHGIVVTDREGRILWSNPAFTQMTGYSRREALGENMRLLKSEEQDEPFYEELWNTILAGETWRGELVNRRKDGSLYPERQAIVPVCHRGDEITHFVSVKEDITEERARQRELEDATQRLSALLDTAAGIIFRVRLSDLRVTYVTPNVEELTGYAAERWTGDPRFWMELVPEEDLERVLDTLASTVEAGVRQVEEEYRLRHADGTLRWYRSIVRFEHDESGEPVAFVGTAVDVSERRKLEERLRHQALHDPLTGLANRTLLEDRMDQARVRASRREKGLAVVMLDIDGFKRINDSLGHTAGDRVLQEVARRLEDAVRAEDTVARWGGDEFCVLLGDVEDRAGLGRVRDRLLGQMEPELSVMGRKIRLEISLGAAVAGLADEPASVPLEEAEDLVRYADEALRRAKDRRDGVTHLYRPDAEGREAEDPLAREHELRGALEREELEPFYQPIVRLDTGEVWGLEPLARWRHPERGLVGPGEFIELAEETGLIHELGPQIVDRACRDVARWREDVDLRLTLNVSGRQFDHAGMVDRLRESLELSSLPPERVMVEVTETSIMRAVHRIDELRELGINVVIDDFGTGYSSLLYLRDLAVDGLKIDISFVQGLGQGKGNTAIVKATLTLGREMRLLVVAEGIETEDQRDRLREMGCGLGQGYLFARPMPAREMEAWLEEAR